MSFMSRTLIRHRLFLKSSTSTLTREFIECDVEIVVSSLVDKVVIKVDKKQSNGEPIVVNLTQQLSEQRC